MPDATRACPECAETIQAAALLCRHCGARFDGKGEPAAPPPPPPKKGGASTILIVLLVVGIGGVFVIGILAALLLPAIARAINRARVTACANNLSMLWKMQNVYMSRFGGPMKSMPLETGEEFWLALERTQPPLVDPMMREVFLCPVREDGETCDYRGPAVPVSRLGGSDPVGADKPDNHGGKGGNLLRKSGDVVELDESEFQQLDRLLRP